MTDNLDKSIELDRSDVVPLNRYPGGQMSKLLIRNEDKRRFRGLLEVAKRAEQTGESSEARRARTELFGFVEQVLTKDAIVLESDLTPNEAAEAAGVSRNTILKMLKTGRLQGYEVGAHWKVSRASLMRYLEEREDMMKMMSKMDAAGFGIDQDE